MIWGRKCSAVTEEIDRVCLGCEARKEQILWMQAQIDTLLDRIQSMLHPLSQEIFEGAMGWKEMKGEEMKVEGDEIPENLRYIERDEEKIREEIEKMKGLVEADV